MKERKYIFITGGVVSGIGKGIASASIANLLQKTGYKVSLMKIDPYLNIDPGTLNPMEHGEVFVTEDGIESDLDLGHYERFTNENTCHLSSLTAGKIYDSVIKKERLGEYKGKTVQIVPHVTNEIQKNIIDLSEKKDSDICIVEIGGTIGDIESLPFIECIRQMGLHSVFGKNCCYIHLSLVPYLSNSEEIKTKPTQHSVRELRSLGINPNIIICRTENSGLLNFEIKEKLSSSCGVDIEDIIEAPNVSCIYEVPIFLKSENIHKRICKHLNIPFREICVKDWVDYCSEKDFPTINISLVGKYNECKDSYKSIDESIKHAGKKLGYNINVLKVDSEKLEGGKPDEEEIQKLAISSGVIIPGGFGPRGFEGKILTATWALKNNIPCLGICYGLHAIMVSMCRNLLGYKNANSTEVDPHTENPVISLLEDQLNISNIGGTMRLGEYDCFIKNNSKLLKYYKENYIKERHRHRWEINNKYIKELESLGVFVDGINLEKNLIEIISVPIHSFFVGVQFHPEFKSRPFNPHPLFIGLIEKCIERENND